MATKVKPKKVLFCDPAVCPNCEYICEGDFICDKKPVPVMVVAEWEPTDEYMWCRKWRRKDGK